MVNNHRIRLEQREYCFRTSPAGILHGHGREREKNTSSHDEAFLPPFPLQPPVITTTNTGTLDHSITPLRVRARTHVCAYIDINGEWEWVHPCSYRFCTSPHAQSLPSLRRGLVPRIHLRTTCDAERNMNLSVSSSPLRPAGVRLILSRPQWCRNEMKWTPWKNWKGGARGEGEEEEGESCT
jgi:hypothetical protein